MECEEAERLLLEALIPISKSWYSIDVVFNRKVENVRIHKSHIPLMVIDLARLHPFCSLYSEALTRLLVEEEREGFFNNQGRLQGKYSNLDLHKYFNVRESLLDLDTSSDDSLYDRLCELGPNPTMILDTKGSTRFYLNILLRKQWRSKSDMELGKGKDVIMKEMYDALRQNPKSAFTTNRYLPSHIEYYYEKQQP